MQPCNSRTLVVYDFDWSLINENCDLYVFKKLAPELVGRPHELYRLNQANDWAYAMHEAMGELFRHGFKKEHIKSAFSDVPLHSSMIKALHLLAEHGCELIIVSGANVIFIDHILEAYNVRHFFRSVFAHHAEYDSHGRLHITAYHDHHKSPHTCSYCPPDMCKGSIVEQYLKERPYFDRVIYIGDSDNDVCPCRQLTRNDHALVRKGRLLERIIDRMRDEEGRLLEAAVHRWADADEVLAIFTRLFGVPAGRL